jgi:hypothetical protein
MTRWAAPQAVALSVDEESGKRDNPGTTRRLRAEGHITADLEDVLVLWAPQTHHVVQRRSVSQGVEPRGRVARYGGVGCAEGGFDHRYRVVHELGD